MISNQSHSKPVFVEKKNKTQRVKSWPCRWEALVLVWIGKGFRSLVLLHSFKLSANMQPVLAYVEALISM